MQPFVWFWRRINRLFIFIGMFFTQFWPIVHRQRNILNTMGSSYSVGRFKIEWPEINSIMGAVIYAMKSNTNKTLLHNVFAPYIKLNCAGCKMNTIEPCNTNAFIFVKVQAVLMLCICKQSHVPVIDHYFFSSFHLN